MNKLSKMIVIEMEYKVSSRSVLLAIWLILRMLKNLRLGSFRSYVGALDFSYVPNIDCGFFSGSANLILC